MTLTVVMLGPAGRPVTDPIDDWTSVEVTLKFNEVGAGQFTAPATPRLLAAIQAGYGVAVYRDGSELMSGPIEKPGALRWAAADQSGDGLATVAFGDNLAYLGERLSYPNPVLAAEAQDVDYWTRTAVNAETVARDLVNLNAAAGALASRRIPRLTLGAVAGVGTPVTVTTRFEPLTDVLRYVCAAGGGLGFRVRTGAAGLLMFEVYGPRDRSKAVVFSRAIGNLTELATDPEAPTATVAIVGGTGEGASRVVIERSNAAAIADGWGRKEVFVNQSGVVDTTGLSQYGDQALADKAEKVGLSAVAVDGAQTRYGIDYTLGDRVSVVLAPGVMVTDLVRAVTVKATPTAGERVSPTIGSSDATSDSRAVTVVRDMLRRLGRLERK